MNLEDQAREVCRLLEEVPPGEKRDAALKLAQNLRHRLVLRRGLTAELYQMDSGILPKPSER